MYHTSIDKKKYQPRSNERISSTFGGPFVQSCEENVFTFVAAALSTALMVYLNPAAGDSVSLHLLYYLKTISIAQVFTFHLSFLPPTSPS